LRQELASNYDMAETIQRDKPIFDRFHPVEPKPVAANAQDLDQRAEELRKAWKQDVPTRPK